MFNDLLRRLGLISARATEPEAVVEVKDDLADIPALVQDGRAAEAEARLRACLARDARHVDALHYLGLICHQSGRHLEAVRHIREAARLAPDAAFVYANLAEVLRATGDIGGAEQAVREALRLNPEQPAAQFNLAVVLSARQAHADALEPALRALAANPEWPQALMLAANLYIALDERAKAQELLDRAYALQPDDPATLVTTLRNRAWMCDWRSDRGPGHVNLAPFIAMLERWAKDPRDAAFDSLNPFVAYEYPVSQGLRDAVTQGYAGRMVESVLGGKPPPPYPSPASGRGEKLRVGYVSADFHRHPTMHLMRGLFALHDRSRFEIFAYSMGPDDGSDYRREAVGGVDHFIDIQGETAQQSAERIRKDGIHILVDLKGYTHAARPEIFALRPAPLRVAWLGYPASTGRGINDYAIVDAVSAPPEQQAHWGEQLVRLPHSYQVNDHRQPIAPLTPERSALGLPALERDGKGFVFACFNHLYKIEPRMFAAWMRILARVPGSVLWLYESNAAARDNLRMEATACGIDAERLVFGPTMAKAEHLARLRQAGLMLDTLWINAHTGASDALWAGVPVLTCPQDTFASRVAASLVTAAGLPQLVCGSLEDYEEMAVRLATQPDELRALREHLESQHERLPLFDTPRFARNLERAFEEMWRRQVAGEKPRGFAVEEPGGS